MKYLFLILIIASCSVIPKSIQNYDISGFSHDGNTFYYQQKPIAVVQAITFSLDGKKLVREINLKVLNPQEMSKIPHLIRYVYDSHKTVEVEVEVDMDNK